MIMSGVGRTINKGLNLFGLGVPDMPKMEEPKAAPDVDDAERQRQSEREMQRRRKGKGRDGTILSETSKLG